MLDLRAGLKAKHSAKPARAREEITPPPGQGQFVRFSDRMLGGLSKGGHGSGNFGHGGIPGGGSQAGGGKHRLSATSHEPPAKGGPIPGGTPQDLASGLLRGRGWTRVALDGGVKDGNDVAVVTASGTLLMGKARVNGDLAVLLGETPLQTYKVNDQDAVFVPRQRR